MVQYSDSMECRKEEMLGLHLEIESNMHWVIKMDWLMESQMVQHSDSQKVLN